MIGSVTPWMRDPSRRRGTWRALCEPEVRGKGGAGQGRAYAGANLPQDLAQGSGGKGVALAQSVQINISSLRTWAGAVTRSAPAEQEQT